ncbi:MAG: flagellar biosynthesis regulator FlaF [Methylovirgula sp.]|nr:flagellar biosynthesis regulator FlaF [Methylovirgula sp.]
MYQFSYKEILDDCAQDARARERLAMQRAIELLELAQQRGVKSMEAAEALNYLNKLWHLFIDDLAKPENDLPDALRAELISIGIWITNEINRMRLGKSDNFGGLIEICAIIRDGLN